MRHLWTLIAAVFVAPLAWILLAAGQDRSARAFVDGGAVDTNDLVRPLLVLAAAGILLGLIGTLRLSPLGAVLVGMVYAASYVTLLVSPSWVLDLVDRTLTVDGHQIDLAAPVRTGTTLLLGSMLLISVASVHRWRQWPRPAADATEAGLPDATPAFSARDRPLGADGLGLTKPRTDGEPNARDGYSTEPEPAMAGRPQWAGALSSDDFGNARWQSDRTRQPSS